MEEWKAIAGYEGLYEVSNLGRIKSLSRIDSRGYKRNEKILKLNKDSGGYLKVSLYKNGKPKQYNVHRLVAIAFIPNPDNLPEVNHKDENRINNYVDNLEWCNRKYNCNYGARNSKISEYQKLRHKMNKIEYLLDSCTAYPDDMCDCLVQIEKVVKE